MRAQAWEPPLPACFNHRGPSGSAGIAENGDVYGANDKGRSSAAPIVDVALHTECYCAVQPPSADQAAPRISAAASLHRNATISAICSGFSALPVGMCREVKRTSASSSEIPSSDAICCTFFLMYGDITIPGHTALQVIAD